MHRISTAKLDLDPAGKRSATRQQKNFGRSICLSAPAIPASLLQPHVDKPRLYTVHFYQGMAAKLCLLISSRLPPLLVPPHAGQERG
jgi:hypothetical protein